MSRGNDAQLGLAASATALPARQAGVRHRAIGRVRRSLPLLFDVATMLAALAGGLAIAAGARAAVQHHCVGRAHSLCAISVNSGTVSTADLWLEIALAATLLLVVAGLALGWARSRFPAPLSPVLATVLGEHVSLPKRRPWFKGWPMVFVGSVLLTTASVVDWVTRVAPVPFVAPLLSAAGELIVPLVAAPGSWLWRRGKRSLAVAATEAVVTDPRPPVLYLRSFDDDTTTAAPVEADLPFSHRRYSEEEQLVLTLSRLGPVVAIGRPGEDLPEVGAARFYVGDDAWQETVARLMSASLLVVLRTGTTPGLRWEIERALGTLRPEQVVFLVPAGNDGWRASLGPLLNKPLPDPSVSESQPVRKPWREGRRAQLCCAILFEPDWTPRVIDLNASVTYPRTMQRVFYRRLSPVPRRLGVHWRHWLPVTPRAAAAFSLKAAGLAVGVVAVYELVELFEWHAMGL